MPARRQVCPDVAALLSRSRVRKASASPPWIGIVAASNPPLNLQPDGWDGAGPAPGDNAGRRQAIGVLPIAVIFLFGQRHFVEDVSTTGLERGDDPDPLNQSPTGSRGVRELSFQTDAVG
jgi:hypothetical protein